MAKTANNVLSRFSFFKCVSSKLKPLDYKASNSTSIFHLFLYCSMTSSDWESDTTMTYSPSESRIPVTQSRWPQMSRGPCKVQNVERGKLLKKLLAGEKRPLVRAMFMSRLIRMWKGIWWRFKYPNHSLPMNSRWAKRPSILSVPKWVIHRLRSSIRSSVFELPFFGRKVQKIGNAIPWCTTDKTRTLIGKQPHIQFVRSNAKV